VLLSEILLIFVFLVIIAEVVVPVFILLFDIKYFLEVRVSGKRNIFYLSEDALVLAEKAPVSVIIVLVRIVDRHGR
jgi:hypothetical protein